MSLELGMEWHLELREEDGAALPRLGEWCALSQCFPTHIMSWHAEKRVVFVKHIWVNRGGSFSLKTSDLGDSTALSLAQLRTEGRIHSLGYL